MRSKKNNGMDYMFNVLDFNLIVKRMIQAPYIKDVYFFRTNILFKCISLFLLKINSNS